VEAGTVKLVGTNADTIVRTFIELADDNLKYKSMSEVKNPYGDGIASIQIINQMLKAFDLRIL
jgi:UDP-N-acetylglucosamine 2-epimerase (non-hydrolysing)